MDPKIIGIVRDEKGAEDISETIRTIAGIRIDILQMGCKPHPYLYLWVTQQQTMEPNKFRIGRNK